MYDVDVKVVNLPPQLDGLSIALITDVHIGPTVHSARVAEIVGRVNERRPDAVAIVGDLVDGFVYNLERNARPLKELRSKYGVFYATGNHEYYHDDVVCVRGFLWTLSPKLFRF